jgi:opacity protein-like surface antigen
MRAPIAVVSALLCLPAAARGQDDRGASVGASVSAMNMESSTQFSFSGTFGYRFSRVVGLDLETTVVPTLKSSFPVVATPALSEASAALLFPIFPTPTFANPNGRVIIFSNNVRVTIPTTTPRLEPFFIAGGGIASVRHTADFVYQSPFPLGTFNRATDFSIALPQFRSFSQHVTSSSVNMVLTLGGGLSVRIASQVSIDADLRMFRFLGDEDRSAGRFGVGVHYRF